MSFVKTRQNHLCMRWPPSAGPRDDATRHDISPIDRLNELRPLNRSIKLRSLALPNLGVADAQNRRAGRDGDTNAGAATARGTRAGQRTPSQRPISRVRINPESQSIT
jgi:hypothetical protein